MFTTSQKEVFQPIWMFSFRWLCGGLVLQQTENNEKKFLAETNQENSEQQNLGAKPKNAKKKKQHRNMHLTWRIYFTRICLRSAQTVKKRGIKNNRPSLDNQPSALRICYWTLQLDFFCSQLRRISRILAVQVKSDEIITGRYKG